MTASVSILPPAPGVCPASSPHFQGSLPTQKPTSPSLCRWAPSPVGLRGLWVSVLTPYVQKTRGVEILSVGYSDFSSVSLKGGAFNHLAPQVPYTSLDPAEKIGRFGFAGMGSAQLAGHGALPELRPWSGRLRLGGNPWVTSPQTPSVSLQAPGATSPRAWLTWKCSRERLLCSPVPSHATWALLPGLKMESRYCPPCFTDQFMGGGRGEGCGWGVVKQQGVEGRGFARNIFHSFF